MTIPKEVRHALDKDYKLVPMADITDEARVIAVLWVEGYESQGIDIPGKQKLASDIMNYARRYATKEMAELKQAFESLSNVFAKQVEQNALLRDEVMLLTATNISLKQQVEFKDEEIKMLKHLHK